MRAVERVGGWCIVIQVTQLADVAHSARAGGGASGRGGGLSAGRGALPAARLHSVLFMASPSARPQSYSPEFTARRNGQYGDMQDMRPQL